MSKTLKTSVPLIMTVQVFRWLVIGSLVGLLSGSASALFLLWLDWATHFREAHLWMIALLPVGGLGVGWLYHLFGKEIEAGHNLILDEIHEPRNTIPLRMAPLVLLGTVATHLFGGSAGREGTAFQMGASLADQLSRPFYLNGEDRGFLLMAGISAGFASVFGTPLAGAVFGLEVLALGRMKYGAIFPCFVAAIVGDQVTLAWGVHHTSYFISKIPPLTLSGFLLAIVAGACFGGVGMLFSRATHQVSAWVKARIPFAPARPFFGGILVAAMVWAVGTPRYIGLGIPTLVEAFSLRLPPWDFAGKFVFTVATLGAGFKGGEVTPLFFIGATLGNALSYVLALPSSLLAGMGFVAVFAGAANTPLASTFMAVELFGSEAGVFAAVACIVSYLFSGHAGIYRAQRIGTSKHRESLGGAFFAVSASGAEKMRASTYAISVLLSGLGIMVAVVWVTHRFPGTGRLTSSSVRPGQAQRASVDPLLLGGPLQRNLEGVTPQVFLAEDTGTTVPEFKTRNFTVRAGQVVSFTLRNHSTVGHQHDWVLVAPGKMQEVGRLAEEAGSTRSWIPNSEDLLAYVLLTEPGASKNILFRAPQSPGDYPFLCSFPGHVNTMNGVLHVEP